MISQNQIDNKLYAKIIYNCILLNHVCKLMTLVGVPYLKTMAGHTLTYGPYWVIYDWAYTLNTGNNLHAFIQAISND